VLFLNDDIIISKFLRKYYAFRRLGLAVFLQQQVLQAVPSYSARRSIFEHFVRTRAEEERKEKRAAQKAAMDGFRQLLEEALEVIC